MANFLIAEKTENFCPFFVLEISKIDFQIPDKF